MILRPEGRDESLERMVEGERKGSRRFLSLEPRASSCLLVAETSEFDCEDQQDPEGCRKVEFWGSDELTRMGYNTLTAEEFMNGQATKGSRWIPWHTEAMKDVVTCDKSRGAGNTH